MSRDFTGSTFPAKTISGTTILAWEKVASGVKEELGKKIEEKKGGKAKKVAKVGIKKQVGYLYFIDKQGDISCAKMVRGGRLMEYSAHLIPEGGVGAVPRLVENGLLLAGDAAGLALNMGYTVRGMEFAVASGRMAAEARESVMRRYP